MFVEIISPDKKLYSGQADLIQLPGTDGSFEIMKNHAPIISTLTKGKIRVISEDNSEHLFEINGGVVELTQNKIIILAE